MDGGSSRSNARFWEGGVHHIYTPTSFKKNIGNLWHAKNSAVNFFFYNQKILSLFACLLRAGGVLVVLQFS